MPNIRARRTRKTKVVKKGAVNAKKKQSKKINITYLKDEVVDRVWNSEDTMMNNYKKMGLATNVNKDIDTFQKLKGGRKCHLLNKTSSAVSLNAAGNVEEEQEEYEGCLVDRPDGEIYKDLNTISKHMSAPTETVKGRFVCVYFFYFLFFIFILMVLFIAYI